MTAFVLCPLCREDHTLFEPCGEQAKRKAALVNQVESDVKNAIDAFAGMVFGGGKFIRDMAAEAEAEDAILEREEEEARRHRIPPERETVPYACKTCHDTGKVGNIPHQVPCPVCDISVRQLPPVPSCRTCGDTRKLGAVGYEIDCPACTKGE